MLCYAIVSTSVGACGYGRHSQQQSCTHAQALPLCIPEAAGALVHRDWRPVPVASPEIKSK